MKKSLLTMIILSVCSFIYGCAAPSPVIPDGSNRVPVNTQEKIEGYKSRIDTDSVNHSESTSLSRKYNNLIQQIAALKADVLVLQINTVALQQAVQKNVVSKPVVPVYEGLAENETIEVRPNSILFRTTQPLNKAAFNPSTHMEEYLLKAARNAKKIEIRGRTDAQADNATDKFIASKRALNASHFLESHGIDSSKITSSFMASGGNVANNKSIEGRAKNRRVEIEVTAKDAEVANSEGPGQTKLGSSK